MIVLTVGRYLGHSWSYSYLTRSPLLLPSFYDTVVKVYPLSISLALSFVGWTPLPDFEHAESCLVPNVLSLCKLGSETFLNAFSFTGFGL